MYDFIIIGAGISGLYFAYKYLQNENYIILEKRDYIGGRARVVDFHEQKINLGAGIIRENNKHLIKLLDELQIKYSEFEASYAHQYKNVSQDEINIIFEKISDTYNKNKEFIDKNKLTFYEFLNLFFDLNFTITFLNICDYTDFLYASVEATINTYPLDELISKKYRAYSIADPKKWQLLIDKLLDKVNNIKLNSKVIKITKKNDFFDIMTDDIHYYCKKLILCGDLDIKKIIFENIDDIHKFYSNVSSVPFMRIYTFHKNKLIFNENIRTTSMLNKIIKVSDNMLMAGYLDCHNADKLINLIIKLNKNEINQILYELLVKSVDDNYKITPVDDYIIKYWHNGIHYFKPGYEINQTKLNDQGILVAGEIISNRQGWVDGAIQSVDDCEINFKKLKNQLIEKSIRKDHCC